MISEGKSFTQGESFRARAEQAARKYRAEVLDLSGYDIYGHILTEDDAKRGFNFLPSARSSIHTAVLKRSTQGKGVDLDRTTRNMLSSQAVCFNLFVPLSLDKAFMAHCLDAIIGNVSIIQDIHIEYTPSNDIFHDQTALGGVDCDVLIEYQQRDGGTAILVVETKFVEPEFSICGFRKSKQKDKCPEGTVIGDDFAGCRYHHRKHYTYWQVTDQSNVFDMNQLKSHSCPFGGSMWQLWTNQTLAFALASRRKTDRYTYVVLHPQDNTDLTRNGSVIDDFRGLLTVNDHFRSISLEEFMKQMHLQAVGTPHQPWVEEFVARYDVSGAARA
jgi:hypothetical protein